MESDPDNIYHLLSYFFLPLAIAPGSFGLFFAFFLVVILLISSALISSSEVAFFSLTVNDLEKITSENSDVTQRILSLKETPRKLLATILIANNFINIAIVIVSKFILDLLLTEDITRSWADAIIGWFHMSVQTETISDHINFFISIVGVTFLLVLFGEVTPKIYAKFNNVKLAKLMSKPLVFLLSFFNPLSKILVNGTNLIEKRLTSKSQSSATSREDIGQAIELTVRNDKHAAHEIDILKGIVKFGDISVKQIMRPRVDVIAVDFRVNFKELLDIVKSSGFSRIPVYDEDFDNITGLLYVKDLINHLNKTSDFEWQSLIRTNILYVPEAKKIDDLLREFQKERLHLAIVVDEYGGSAGIVTLEDIMEEVFGEIKDEFDEEEPEYRKLDDLNYIFEGKTLLNDVCRVIGEETTLFDEIKGDADSVAGLVLEVVGHIPKVDTEVSYNDFHFKIVSVDKRRIKQVLLTIPAS